MATKKKRATPIKRKKATKARGTGAKKAPARGTKKAPSKRKASQALSSQEEHAELFVFLNAMHENENNTADLFAEGDIGAALDASGVQLTAKQRELAINTLESIGPEKLAAVADLLRLPDVLKVAIN